MLGGAGSPCTTTTTTACIVDDTLAQGTKNGYLFVATPHAASGVNTTNTVSAVPVSFNQTGVRGFCANEDAVVRSSVPPVTAQPAQMITDATCGALVVLQ